MAGQSGHRQLGEQGEGHMVSTAPDSIRMAVVDRSTGIVARSTAPSR
jgi:hypothetical protein